MKKIAKTEFEYKLSTPVKVAKKGDEELVFKIKLKAPTAKHRAHMIRLKQGFLKAVISAQNSATIKNARADADTMAEAAEAKIDGAAIIGLLYISDIDVAALEEEFRNLLLAGICEVDEGINLNAHMLDSCVSLEDFESIMGEYLANFIVSSSI